MDERNNFTVRFKSTKKSNLARKQQRKIEIVYYRSIGICTLGLGTRKRDETRDERFQNQHCQIARIPYSDAEKKRERARGKLTDDEIGEVAGD